MLCPACNADNFPGADLCNECGLDLAGLDVKAWGIDPEDPILARRLEQLALKKPMVIAPEASAAEAIERLTKEHEGCLFVIEHNKLIGVVTERDFATRLASRDRDPEKVTVAQLMTTDPLTVRKTDRLALALHRMGVEGYRHLPVMDGKELVGFLSMRSVLGVLAGA